MKLPDIEYGAPVPDRTRAIGLVDDAQRRAADTFQSGLRAFGHELVKTQSQRAAVQLAEGLSALEQDLDGRKTVSADWVREQLGDQADALLQSAGVREQLVRRAIDPVTGQPVELERQEIPTWVVAGAVLEKRAQDLLRESSGSISVGEGWQAAFQDAAAGDLVQMKSRFAAKQAKAMHEHIRAETTASADALVRLGRFGQAISWIDSSTAFDGGEKAALKEKVLAIEQESQWKDDAQTLARKAVAGSLFPGSDRVDPAKAQASLDADLEKRPAAFRLLARAELDGAIRFHNSAQVERLGAAAGQALQAFQSPGPDGKPRFSTAAIGPELRAWFTDPKGGKERAEYWHTLLMWEQGAQSHARGERQLPTDEQSRNYLYLVSDMHEHPETYRNMSSAQLADLWMRTKDGATEPPLSLRDWGVVVDLFARIRDPAAPVKAGQYDGQVLKAAEDAGLLKRDGAGKLVTDGAAGEGVKELGRRVQRFIEDEVKKTRKPPDGTVIDGFIADQLRREEVQRFFGLWRTTRTTVTPEPVTTRATVPGEPVAPIQPGGQGAAPPAAPPPATGPQRTGAVLPKPKTPEEAALLPPGTRFIDPNGVVRTR